MITHAGLVALVGRPNVGKSSLLNTLVGSKVSIVSHKPQTTRHQVAGIMHRDTHQVVFVDTPGQADTYGMALNRALDRTARAAMQDVDLLLWVIEAGKWTAADDELARRVKTNAAPLGLVLSKIDRLRDKKRLLPLIHQLSERVDADFLVPVSAHKGTNLLALETEILRRMPAGEGFYPSDLTTPQGESFMIAERIREQVFLRMHQELPYRVAVTVDDRSTEDGTQTIHATIWLDKASHKSIVIGAQGSTLKRLQASAQRTLTAVLGMPVELHLWVKVREGWADNERSLQAFGYGGDGQ